MHAEPMATSNSERGGRAPSVGSATLPLWAGAVGQCNVARRISGYPRGGWLQASTDDTLAGIVTVAGSALPDGTELVAGRYRIVRWLGGGGMGRVYEAVDTELDEQVALKVLRPGMSDDALERFRREVKLTRRIQHRNVARMFDIGEHDGEKFLTMELVDGEPLDAGRRADAVAAAQGDRASRSAPGSPPRTRPASCIAISSPTTSCSRRGTGRVVITDFGIARSVEDPGVTQVGAVIGTPRYMAPEQLAGREVDARADLFSLGVMLFELATGERPWPGDNAIAIAVAQATSEPRAIDTQTTEIPPAFAEIIAACLQLEPEHRPASATEVGAAIASGTSGLIARRRSTRAAKPPPLVATIRARREPTAAADRAREPTSLAVLPIAVRARRRVPRRRHARGSHRHAVDDARPARAPARVTSQMTPTTDPRALGRDARGRSRRRRRRCAARRPGCGSPRG